MADTTQTVTTIAAEPDWMQKLRQDNLANAAALTAKPKDIGYYQVADLSPEQKQAIALAHQGIGSYQPYLNKAADSYDLAAALYGGSTSAYNPNDVSTFMNPYQQLVTQQENAEAARNAAIQNQTLAGQAARAGAYGGSRFGVQMAEQAGNLARIQGEQTAKDYQNNYSQAQTAALNAFQNQKAREQTAASGITTLGQNNVALGQTTSALGQGDTSFLYNMGNNLQQFQQKQLEAQRMNTDLAANAPYQQFSYYNDILNKTPSGQQTTQATTAAQPNMWGQLLGLGTTALGAYNLMNKAP